MKNTTVDRTALPAHLLKDQQERLRGVAEKVFPTGTRLIVLPGMGDFVLLASWKLGTDASRPNKRSKTVQIVISREAIEDYAQGINGKREYTDQRFESLLRNRLAQFDPSHDAPLGTEPPMEKWQIGTIELNG
jgi:hypothetical protein